MTISAIAVEKGIKSVVHKYIMVSKGHAATTTELSLKPNINVKHDAIRHALKSCFAVGALMSR